jgi:hypothetical protein
LARPEISAWIPSASSSWPALAGGPHVVLALGPLLVDQALDLLVLARVQRRERQVLELPLDRVDAEPVGDRRVDLQGLLRLVDLLLLGHRADRPHVVQAVGELDEDDPDVRGHRHHHLAVVLRLGLVAGLEGDALELRDAVDQARDLVAELTLDLLERRARVLDRVVEQRGAERRGVQPHPGADLGHADGMGDEVLAGLALLVGVVLTREDESLDHAAAVDPRDGPVRVLLDDREEVREQLALHRGQVRGDLDGGFGRRAADLVDGVVARHRGGGPGGAVLADGRRIRDGRGRVAVRPGRGRFRLRAHGLRIVSVLGHVRPAQSVAQPPARTRSGQAAAGAGTRPSRWASPASRTA